MKYKQDDVTEIELDEETWRSIDNEARKLGLTPETFIMKCIRDHAETLVATSCAPKAIVRYPPAMEA